MNKRETSLRGVAKEAGRRGNKKRSDLLGCSAAFVLTDKPHYLTAFTIASNAFGSFIAKSAITLRLRAMPLALTLPMNSE